MEGKARVILFAFVFLCITACSAKSHEYQNLVLRSLPQPHSLSWSEEESEILTMDSETTLTVQLQLHHRDTLSFNATPEALFNTRLHRDTVRVQTLTSIAAVSKNNNSSHGKDFSSPVISGLAQGSGEYFTRLGIGTPPNYAYMVLDTGSDVVWIQCSPCRNCYSQTDPVFDPTKSTSFVALTCGSLLCRRLDSPGCNQRRNTCLYQVSYGDGSFTFGEFSTETLTSRRTTVHDVAFGCGHDNQGLFVGAAGLLGLGRGKLSFPSQTGDRFGRKFSYCLADRLASSTPSSVVFGDSAVPGTAVFTPLLTNPKIGTFYYLGLTGISVGGVRVRGITASLFELDSSGNGGVIIDSGTSVTRLTRPAYAALRDAFRSGASRLKRAPDFSLFDTCFDLTGKTEVKVPTVVMHFVGADVSLPASNYLIPVAVKGTYCFAFAGTTGGLSIIGNIQQQGFRVLYDLAGSRIGFVPRGCT
ncbi:aspartyl protease family protein 2-like [Cornus florida]|uniref:aspartyl protease family protein 2-like n=1 Tax=Cornus florida TaxID=4283 RepID=UPI00289F73F8|nr:aspartyl protease family protein 2-like [Cornus florida]